MASRAGRITRGSVVVGVFALATLWGAAAASAHVTVSAPGASSGGSDQVITFRVPTESATASTVGLQVKLPTDTPIASVLVAPHTGWTEKVTSVKLAKPIVTDDGNITEAVSTITWKADTPADGIKPGEFDQFVVIAGQLPTARSLTFPAIQTYSDGTTVSWIETQAPGSTDEPEHPAPVLSLTSSGTGSPGGSSTAAPTVTASTSSSSSGTATTGVILGAIGVLLGAGALAVSLAVSLRRRRTP
ncbi:MAG: nuclear export factor [Jatrophihabitans sp.]|nr:nuclear export factor [Jatrophihabitans sp.]